MTGGSPRETLSPTADLGSSSVRPRPEIDFKTENSPDTGTCVEIDANSTSRSADLGGLGQRTIKAACCIRMAERHKETRAQLAADRPGVCHRGGRVDVRVMDKMLEGLRYLANVGPMEMQGYSHEHVMRPLDNLSILFEEIGLLHGFQRRATKNLDTAYGVRCRIKNSLSIRITTGTLDYEIQVLSQGQHIRHKLAREDWVYCS